MNLLFVCARNRLRSPTAERIFADWPGVETASAGTAADAEAPVTAELLDWADVIMVMEPVHRGRLQARHGRHLRGKHVVCLSIRDDYDYMQAELVALLESRVIPHLPRT